MKSVVFHGTVELTYVQKHMEFRCHLPGSFLSCKGFFSKPGIHFKQGGPKLAEFIQNGCGEEAAMCVNNTVESYQELSDKQPPLRVCAAITIPHT